MSMPVKISAVKNPLMPADGLDTFPVIHTGATALDYIRSVTGDLKPDEIIVSVNGSFVDPYFVPSEGAQVVFCPVIAGSSEESNKGMMRTVAMMAVMVAAAYVTGGMAAAGYSNFAIAMTSAAMTVGGGLLVNTLIPLQMEEDKLNPSIEHSQNYGWTAGRNDAREGIVLPSMIGERRITPPRIGAYRYTVEEKQKQYLRLLYAIGDDIIDEIAPTDVFINDQPLSDYANASHIFTVGDDSETVAPQWFDDQIVETQVSTDISEQAEIHEGDVNYINFTDGVYQPATPYAIAETVEVVSVHCHFPNGLYTTVTKTITKGEHEGETQTIKKPYSGFQFTIRYRRGGNPSWITKTLTVPAPRKYLSPTDACFSLTDIPADTYDLQLTTGASAGNQIQVKKIVGLSSLSGVGHVTTQGSAVDKIGIGILFPSGLYQMLDDGRFEGHSVKLYVSWRVNGTTPWSHSKYVTYFEATSSPLRKFIEITTLQKAKYDVRVYVHGLMPTDSKYQHTCYFDYLQEATKSDIVYRGVALLGLEILATDDLHGQFPVIEAKVRRSDYATGRPSSNPAWAAYYRLLRHGIAPDKINESDFITWAAFCDTEQLTVALYIDTQLNLQTVLNQIGIAGRGIVVNRAGKWGVLIDQPAEPVQTFTLDNIVSDSFSETFLPAHDLANCITCWFFDENNKYRKTAVEVRDPAIASSDIKKTEITLYGVTKLTQAKAHAMYMLNHTRLTNRTVSWKAEVEAINCQVGDVVYLQHDVPEWGFVAGRVLSADISSVTCDIPIDFSDSENSSRAFRICIRHKTPKTGEEVDFIEVKNIVNPYLLGTPANESVTTFTLDTVSWERTPAAGDLVSVGWVTGTESSTSDEILSLKQFRIINLERSQDQQFTITAVEYYDDAYVDDYVVTLPTPESGLSPIILPVVKSAWRVIGGVEQSYISLSWLGNAPLYYVFYKTVGAGADGWSEWFFHSSTPLTSLEIHDFQVSADYQFSISAENNPETGTTVFIYHSEENHDPIIEPITNIRCVQTGNSTFDSLDLDATWDAFPAFTLKAYRVEILNAANSVIRTELTTENRYHYTFAKNTQDNNNVPLPAVRMRVVVIDKNDNESASVTQVLTNNLPVAISNIRTVTGSGTTFTGKDLDILWNASTEEDFKAYEVVITHGGADLRTEYVTEPHYLYTYSMNEGDGLSNSIVIKIRVIDLFNQASGIASGTFVNPVPATPSGLSTEQWMRGIRFRWSAATDSDFDHFEYQFRVGSDAWGPWASTKGTSATRFLTEQEAIDGDGDAWIRINVKTIDTFGSESGTADISALTGSIHIDPTDIKDIGQISGAFTRIPVIDGDSWTNNSPVAGSVEWNAHDLWFDGIKYEIAAGNTALEYIYWVNATAVYATSATEPTLAEGDFVIAQNSGGTATLAWDAQANAVIGSGYIARLAVITANIADLAVNNAKIADLSALKINAGILKSLNGDLQFDLDNATLLVNNTARLNIEGSGKIRVSAADGLIIRSGAELAIRSGGRLMVESGGGIRLSGADGIAILSGGSMDIRSGGQMDIDAGGKLNLSGGDININTGKLSVKTTDGIEVTAGNNIKILSGGDIVLNSVVGGANVGAIKFFTDGQTSYSSIYRINNDLFIRSSSTSVSLYIGREAASTVGDFLVTHIASNGSTRIEALSSDQSAIMRVDALPGGASMRMTMQASATLSETIAFLYNGSSYRHFYPETSHKAVSLGRSGNAWKDVYYETLYAQCLHLDNMDDLAILHQMAPSGRMYQETQLPELSINSLPKWMTNYDELRAEVREECGGMVTDEDFDEFIKDPDFLGYRYYRNFGHFTDLVAGAVRQLDRKFQKLENKINGKTK